MFFTSFTVIMVFNVTAAKFPTYATVVKAMHWVPPMQSLILKCHWRVMMGLPCELDFGRVE